MARQNKTKDDKVLLHNKLMNDLGGVAPQTPHPSSGRQVGRRFASCPLLQQGGVAYDMSRSSPTGALRATLTCLRLKNDYWGADKSHVKKGGQVCMLLTNYF